MADGPGDLANATTALALTKAGLPERFVAPVARTLGILVGRFMPEAFATARQRAQAIQDVTDARTLVSQAVAIEVAKRAGQDEGLIERAYQAQIGDYLRKQENREAVAHETVEELKALPPPDGVAAEPAEPEADWMNVFSSYAEHASSERLRNLWGRVLAGEIRSTGSFSLRTLRFISELDAETASIFQEFANRSIANQIPNFRPNGTSSLDKELTLEDAGLISGAAGTLSSWIDIHEDGMRHLVGDGHVLFIRGTPNKRVTFNTLALTRTGIEIKKILPPADEKSTMNELVFHIEKDGIDSIQIGRKTTGNRATLDEMLYEAKPAIQR